MIWVCVTNWFSAIELNYILFGLIYEMKYNILFWFIIYLNESLYSEESEVSKYTFNVTKIT